MDEEVHGQTTKPRRRIWPLVLLILLFGAWAGVLLASPPPRFKLLQGLKPVEVRMESVAGAWRRATVYRIKSEFRPGLERLKSELESEGGWTKHGASTSGSPVWAEFHRGSGPHTEAVEVVQEEPGLFHIASHGGVQWTPGSGKDEPGVCTIIYTRRGAPLDPLVGSIMRLLKWRAP